LKDTRSFLEKPPRGKILQPPKYYVLSGECYPEGEKNPGKELHGNKRAGVTGKGKDDPEGKGEKKRLHFRKRRDRGKKQKKKSRAFLKGGGGRGKTRRKKKGTKKKPT